MQEDGIKFELLDVGKSAIGNQVDWQLLTGSRSSPALIVKRGLFDKATVFQTCKGVHLTNMHPSLLWEKQSTISWQSKTYRSALEAL